MYPSSLRTRAISSFIREVGISAVSCIALLALRIRVSMSAIGSVSISLLLPAALWLPTAFCHAGDRAVVRELAQADPAEAELLEHRARPAAPVAARVVAHLEPVRALLLDDEGRLGHAYWSFLSSAANGSPRLRRSANACSSVVWDEVVIVTSRPRIDPTES